MRFRSLKSSPMSKRLAVENLEHRLLQAGFFGFRMDLVDYRVPTADEDDGSTVTPSTAEIANEENREIQETADESREIVHSSSPDRPHRELVGR